MKKEESDSIDLNAVYNKANAMLSERGEKNRDPEGVISVPYEGKTILVKYSQSSESPSGWRIDGRITDNED